MTDLTSYARQRNYLAFDEIETLINSIQRDFPEISQRIEIGKTVEGNTIHAVVFAAPASILDFDAHSPIQVDPTFDVEGESRQRLSILIDAAHHAREFTSIAEVCYVMIRLLHGYLHNDPEVKR
jgi:murein tripeptide amidase MpaA